MTWLVLVALLVVAWPALRLAARVLGGALLMAVRLGALVAVLAFALAVAVDLAGR